jgi:predicted amidohydrolase
MSQPDQASDTAPFKVGLVQMTSAKSLEDNAAFLDTHIRQAASAGATYIQTPENSLLMDLDGERVAKICGSAAYRAALDALGRLATELGVTLHIGATPVFLEGAEARPFLQNRSFLFGPDGALIRQYNKIHMFDVSLPEGETYKESATYKPGVEAVVADCGFARLGLSICYDLRFAALYRALAQAGAEMISVPAAFTQYTGKAHWHVLLRARAIETGCFVLASAQTGTHETGRATFGHSLVISPWGEVLVDGGTSPGVSYAMIDLAEIAAARRAVPSLTHDRDFKAPV